MQRSPCQQETFEMLQLIPARWFDGEPADARSITPARRQTAPSTSRLYCGASTAICAAPAHHGQSVKMMQREV